MIPLTCLIGVCSFPVHFTVHIFYCRVSRVWDYFVSRSTFCCFLGRVRTFNLNEEVADLLLRWIFFVLSLLGLRQWLARIMPQSLVLAVGAGIGLFIAFIGLGSGGLGVIGGDVTNFVGLGGCMPEYWVSTELAGFCQSHVLQNPTVWLGVFMGGILTVLLMLYRIKGAILIGIFLTSIISWPRPTSVTYFPHTPAGDDLFDFFKKVVTFHPLKHIGNVIDVSAVIIGSRRETNPSFKV